MSLSRGEMTGMTSSGLEVSVTNMGGTFYQIYIRQLGTAPLKLTAELTQQDGRPFLMDITHKVPINKEPFFFVAEPACSDALNVLILEDNNVRRYLESELEYHVLHLRH